MSQQSDNDATNLARFGPEVFRRLADTSADGIGMARLRDEIIPQVQATGTWIGELKLMSPSGVIWQTIQNIFLIRDEHGVPVAFANVITDLTESARVTEALRVSQAAIDSSINAIAMVRDVERGRAAGFSDYLTKPIKVTSFLESIDRCLPGCTENKA